MQFVIKTGKKEEIEFERDAPAYCSTILINRKLYVCGGQRLLYNGKSKNLADFFSLDYSGRSVELR